MWNNTNPAELFSGTTWELLTAGKNIQSGSTALSTGGSNSISISKTNLPNVKLKVDTVSATIGNHYHYIFSNTTSGAKIRGGIEINNTQYACPSAWSGGYDESYVIIGVNKVATLGKTSDSGAGNTSSISPYTETLGNGTALSIQPTYITLKFWKRLS